MCFFKKKMTSRQKTVNDIMLIKSNMQAIDVLIAYAEDNAIIKERLLKLQEKIKYLNPIDKDNIQSLDKKIGNKIGDLKIELSKDSNKVDFERVQNALKELEIAVVERQSKVVI